MIAPEAAPDQLAVGLLHDRAVGGVEQLDAPGELLVAQEQRVRRGVGQAAGDLGLDHV